jgi:epoxyqueuosine reductase QueG
MVPQWAYRQTPEAGICSNWSERHAAYAAGLGTFGLSDGLITEAGKAVRIGSVVVEADISITPRTAASHTANCLFHARGSCGTCIDRCPVAAISTAGHDKNICHAYIRSVTAPYARQITGEQVTPCGLCQTRIPCESRNPLKNSAI